MQTASPSTRTAPSPAAPTRAATAPRWDTKKGRPLALDDDPLVPEDLRAAHRILKNAGIAPPEVKKLGLMRVRIESRYYTKLRVKLAR